MCGGRHRRIRGCARLVTAGTGSPVRSGVLVATVAEAMAAVERFAAELAAVSDLLDAVERELETTELDYQQAVDVYEIGLYVASEENGTRLPSEALRLKLA